MQILLVDGSNVVRYKRESSEFRTYIEEERSNMLLKRINDLNKGGEIKIEIYFDGPYRKLINESILTDLFFSKYKKADNLIVNAIYSYRDMGLEDDIFVVSSDNLLCKLCEQYQAKIIKTPEFLRKIDFIDFAYMA